VVPGTFPSHFAIFPSKQNGDLLEYVSNGNANCPAATYARLLRCGPRSPTSLEGYTSSLASAAVEAPDQVLRDVTRCPVGFEAVLQQPAPTPETKRAVLLLLEKVTFFEGDRQLHGARIKQLMDVVGGSPFLTSANALLAFAREARKQAERSGIGPPIISQTSGRETQDADSDLVLVQSFLSILLKHDRGNLPKIVHILPEVAMHRGPESPPSCPGIKFLLQLIRSAAGDYNRGLNTPWNQLPLLPTLEEMGQSSDVSTRDLFVPVVIKTGPYPSSGDYLDTYFRLLREDCFESLRTGIEQLRKGSLDDRDMRVYDRVKVVGVHFLRGSPGLAFALSFRPRKQVADWAHSSALMTGGLLCLFPDGDAAFRTPIWAVVANRQVSEYL
jgi:hypothetical protein